MKHLIQRIFGLFALTLALGLTGCNTMNGIGQDLQKAGDAISGASKK